MPQDFLQSVVNNGGGRLSKLNAPELRNDSTNLRTEWNIAQP